MRPFWCPGAFRVGEDPDPRFTLANERTFLAWIRTALALVAAAVGFEAFGSEMVGPTVHATLVVGVLTGSTMLSVSAFHRWIAVERALRLGRGLPVPTFAGIAAGLVLGSALTLLMVEVTR